MDVYLKEYSADDAITRYTSRTAGHGISYLLENDYAQVYVTAIDQFLKVARDKPLRLLEFGCGGGMNIIALVSLLERRGRKVEQAVGTDFSAKLISAANSESKMLLTPEQQAKTHFAVARNEAIVADLAAAFNGSQEQLGSNFDVILGVNTFRYCHRLNKAQECAEQLASLLVPGGICIMIDMNQKFPAFRSKFRDRRTKPEAERYLPSLEEYASPFAKAGLEILRKENFCWVPHSASARLTQVCRLLTPALNAIAKTRAMRSLVISRKPV
ncbi:MAG: class I SAM-dependent methyltransferase [Acidobacteriota bacterium]|nr:class I SAM-dependent methyltransferase [Acidobacteriota bacterium]